MLGVPLAVGMVVALGTRPWAEVGGGVVPAILLSISVLSFYLARYPLSLWVRFPQRGREHGAWMVLTAVIGVVAGALLVLGWGRWLLIPAGLLALALSLVHLGLVGERQERGVVGELLGVAGLTLTAPLTAYAVSGLWSGESFTLWLVCFLFFGSSVFYVKMRVMAASLGKAKVRQGEGDSSLSWGEKRRLGWPVLSYHLGALVMVGALGWSGALPPLAIIAFLPLAAHQSADVAGLSSTLTIRRIGFTLLAHSLLFGALTIGVFLWR